MLTEDQAVEKTRLMLGWRKTEETRLDLIHAYYRDKQKFLWLPTSAPREVRRLADISRVNVIRFIVNVPTQAIYVDGYRSNKSSEPTQAWDVWQQNRFDARQIGVHRATFKYGVAYVTVLPGDPVPVIRGVSPRRMTAVYDDDDWPELALEKRRDPEAQPGERSPREQLFRLFDKTHTYWMTVKNGTDPEFKSAEEHGSEFVPVIRFRDTDDLDDDVLGEVEPHMRLQDQINITSFGLQVAQHYGAFRQRYVLGWLATTEEQKLKASAAKLWTFEDPDVKVGEFGQTDLKGYIESREASLRHLATVSQTPAHELLGQLVNLSAEALAAAEASHQRKNLERKTMVGEAHEQVMEAVERHLKGAKHDPAAQVRFRDTESRSLAQMVDALGKLAQMLGVPVQELWERVPGVTETDVERWKQAAAQADPFVALQEYMDRQIAGA